MRRRIATLIACAGCYDPTIPPAGVPCDEVCPGSQVCVEHVCRDATDLPPPPGDSDRDGVTDDVDDCPAIANADQHDEDADGLGDACDPCPHVAGDAADTDGDGVGDACDPEPAIARQRWRLFDPFTRVRPEWSGLDDTVVANDHWSIPLAGGYAELALADGELRIEAGGSFLAIGPNTDPHQLAIAFGHDDTGEKYHYGELYDVGQNDGGIKITEATGVDFLSHAETPYGTLPLGRWSMRIDESASAHRIALACTLGGIPYPAIAADTPNLLTGRYIDIGAQNLEMTVDHVVVIETGP